MDAMKETVKHHIIKFFEYFVYKILVGFSLDKFIFVMETRQAFQKLMSTPLPYEVEYSKNTTDKIFSLNIYELFILCS